MKRRTKIMVFALVAVCCVAGVLGFKHTPDVKQNSAEGMTAAASGDDGKLKLDKTQSAVSITGEPDFVQDGEEIPAAPVDDGKLKLDKAQSAVPVQQERN